jgi:hypothetical protein
LFVELSENNLDSYLPNTQSNQNWVNVKILLEVVLRYFKNSNFRTDVLNIYGSFIYTVKFLNVGGSLFSK